MMTDPATPPARDPAPPPALDAVARQRLAGLAGDPAALAARLAEVEAEWDIERVLQANATATALIGTGIGLARSRGLLRLNLPAAVAALVVQHAIRGVRPPVSLLRRLGFRSAAEIEGERLALLALTGTPNDAARPRPRPSLARSVARHGGRLLRRRRTDG